MRRAGFVSSLVVLMVALMVAMTAGCGIPTDDDARVISDDQLPPSLVDDGTTTSIPSPDTETARRFVPLVYVLDDRLAPIPAEIAPDASLAEVIAALTAGPVDAVAATGYRSELAPGEAVRSVSLERGVAVIDLVDGFSQGDQVLGLGQIVLTATSQPGVGQVRFTLNGQPVDVPRADGTVGSGLVTRDDYVALLAEPA